MDFWNILNIQDQKNLDGIKVPDILKSGHHENISKWRRKQALDITFSKRPDLLKKAKLTREEKEYIKNK